MDNLAFTIGSEMQGITIAVQRRAHPTADDYWDGNWLSTTVVFSLGDFKGSISGDIRAGELDSFQRQIEILYQSLKGKAKFTTIESWMEFGLAGDGLGHVVCAGFLMDRPGIGNCLSFRFSIDQTYLPAIIDGISAISARFPVRGQP